MKNFLYNILPVKSLTSALLTLALSVGFSATALFAQCPSALCTDPANCYEIDLTVQQVQTVTLTANQG
ncbi:MAG: hypothetical protein Q7U74_01775, partial [Saprospiraceae bacterium]|nr:hypothetical protein [Saprospiraceae bacterium]